MNLPFSPFFQFFLKGQPLSRLSFPVGTRCGGDVSFLLSLHCDIDRLRIEIEATSLYDIIFQHHSDVAAIT